MGMTMTQRILARHAGLPAVAAGQFVDCALDLVLGNDITAPIAIGEFEKCGARRVFNREKVALVPDHFTPNKDIAAAGQCARMRRFALSQGIVNYFEVGEMGVEHALLPEKGLVVCGDAVIGADSHTCTYGALGAFSTGGGSTDMAAAMATGRCWFKVPAALRFELCGKLGPGSRARTSSCTSLGRSAWTAHCIGPWSLPARACPPSRWTTGSQLPTWPSRPEPRTVSSSGRTDPRLCAGALGPAAGRRDGRRRRRL